LTPHVARERFGRTYRKRSALFRSLELESEDELSNQEFRLTPGVKAPAFSLLDQNGQEFSSSKLAGKKAILYFYPAAGSPGCSKEAADFQDRISEFTAAGYEVIGISPDEPAKLKDFEDAQQLTFPLLSDPDLAAHKAYGAFGVKSLYGRTYEGVLRSTAIVDENFNVMDAFYSVKSTGHVDMLLKRIS
jgi:thioredoxin-dependent peroxiredoxin